MDDRDGRGVARARPRGDARADLLRRPRRARRGLRCRGRRCPRESILHRRRRAVLHLATLGADRRRVARDRRALRARDRGAGGRPGPRPSAGALDEGAHARALLARPRARGAPGSRLVHARARPGPRDALSPREPRSNGRRALVHVRLGGARGARPRRHVGRRRERRPERGAPRRDGRERASRLLAHAVAVVDDDRARNAPLRSPDVGRKRSRVRVSKSRQRDRVGALRGRHRQRIQPRLQRRRRPGGAGRRTDWRRSLPLVCEPQRPATTRGPPSIDGAARPRHLSVGRGARRSRVDHGADAPPARMARRGADARVSSRS